jgi:hypothetical protein
LTTAGVASVPRLDHDDVVDNSRFMIRSEHAEQVADFLQSRPVGWVVGRWRRLEEQARVVDEVAIARMAW